MKMVWKEILFGFTVAGFIAVFVPQSFWDAIFVDAGGGTPSLPAVGRVRCQRRSHGLLRFGN